MIAVVLVALVAVAAALAAPPTKGNWTGKSTNGGSSGSDGKISFSVTANHKELKHFSIPAVGAYCAPEGYEVVEVYVPKAKIHHGHVHEKYDASPETETLEGTFTSANKFKGEVIGSDFCGYDVKFVAHPKG